MSYVESDTNVQRSERWTMPSDKNMRELRGDACLIHQLCAGIDIAK